MFGEIVPNTRDLNEHEGALSGFDIFPRWGVSLLRGQGGNRGDGDALFVGVTVGGLSMGYVGTCGEMVMCDIFQCNCCALQKHLCAFLVALSPPTLPHPPLPSASTGNQATNNQQCSHISYINNSVFLIPVFCALAKLTMTMRAWLLSPLLPCVWL